MAPIHVAGCGATLVGGRSRCLEPAAEALGLGLGRPFAHRSALREGLPGGDDTFSAMEDSTGSSCLPWNHKLARSREGEKAAESMPGGLSPA